MTKVLEVNEEGELVIPADLLNGAEPHQRYIAEPSGTNLLLRPESDSDSTEMQKEEQFLQSLLAAGHISEIKRPDRGSKMDREPVPIKGKATIGDDYRGTPLSGGGLLC